MAIDKSANIHPGAIVHEGAEIGPDVTIGPFCIIGPQARLERGVQVKSHAVVTGQTVVGPETVIFPFVCLGEIPEDKKFTNEESGLIIGARNQIREGTTLNSGTASGNGVTKIGDDCIFMAKAHVGHNTQIGNRVVVAAQAAIAGHCIVEDEVIIGGLSGLHQFVRLGRGCIVAGLTKVAYDVIPYGLVQAPPGDVTGLNIIGLKRRGVSRGDILALQVAFETLKKDEGTFSERAERLRGGNDSAYVKEVANFILRGSKRSFLKFGALR